MFFDNNEDETLMVSAREALERIKNNKDMKSVLQETQQIHDKFKMSQSTFDPFDMIAFEGKLKVDLMIFDQLLQKIDEQNINEVQTLITDLYKNIKDIYEFINITPSVYNGVSLTLLESSIEDSRQIISKIIFEFLDSNFYKLDAKQRYNKYFEAQKDLSKKLIEEGANPEEAIAFSTKSCVMEQLIKNIAFPFAEWSRLNYLTEDVSYGEIFDQSKLIDLVNSFNTKCKSLAKITTTCI